MAHFWIFEYLRTDRDLRRRLHRDHVCPQRIYRERDSILQRFSRETAITHLRLYVYIELFAEYCEHRAPDVRRIRAAACRAFRMKRERV